VQASPRRNLRLPAWSRRRESSWRLHHDRHLLTRLRPNLPEKRGTSAQRSALPSPPQSRHGAWGTMRPAPASGAASTGGSRLGAELAWRRVLQQALFHSPWRAPLARAKWRPVPLGEKTILIPLRGHWCRGPRRISRCRLLDAHADDAFKLNAAAWMAQNRCRH